MSFENNEHWARELIHPSGADPLLVSLFDFANTIDPVGSAAGI